MPITRQDVNDDITAKISGKTTAKSLTQIEDGENRVLMMDYLDQQAPEKTAGSVEADNVSPYKFLSYNLNTVSTTGASDKVVLPTVTKIGFEVLVFALNNASSFSVRGNQSGTSVLSSGGVATTAGSISIGANISARFIHLGSGYWKAEII